MELRGGRQVDLSRRLRHVQRLGFYMDIRNLQATLTAGTCSPRIIFNVPDARSAGVELELAAQPTTFFDFAVSASVADARLQSTITSTDANRGPPAPADDAPLPGRDRGHVALAGRRRLGRLPQRDLPARRLALHAGRATRRRASARST